MYARAALDMRSFPLTLRECYLPTSKDNHQLENANFYKENDCCWLIEQHLFEEKIEDCLRCIFEKKEDFMKKKENLKKLNFQNTWINVNQKIFKILNEN